MTLAPGVKQRLLKVAAKDGMANLNDTGVAILAEHFGLDYEPTGRSPRELKDSDYTNWSMPLALRDRIGDRLRAENKRRRRRSEPALSRADYLNAIFIDYLDARRIRVRRPAA